MAKKINVLFVCKHNVFRSKVAEAYFKKANKNKEINVASAGIIKADKFTRQEKDLIKKQRAVAKNFGIKIKNDSKILKISLLSKQDVIVIVADDVPNIFNNPFYLKSNLKIILWKISDVKGTKNDDRLILKDIQKIIKNVDDLIKKLEVRK